MSKTKTHSDQPAPSFWRPFMVIGLFGMLLGGTLTYLALLPRLNHATSAGSAVPSSDPTNHLPSPSLTAGQSPAQAALTLANFHYDHKNWSEAIRYYESAIKQGRDDPNVRTDLGNVYRFTGRSDEALGQYERAQMMDPNHEFSLFNQGGLYLENFNQPAKAIAKWEEYLVRFPNGRNVQAARQLIERAQALTTGSTPLPTAAANPVHDAAAEALILRQIQAGKTKSEQP